MALDSTQPRSDKPRLSRRVLIVDDNEDAAELLQAVLERWGCSVLAAHDGPTALQMTREDHFDVVLLDIGLPGMDGHEVAQALRSEPAAPRIIALSGYGQAADRDRSRQAGCEAHLVKPVDLATLRELLSR